jgi:hypothetical protein
MADAGAAAGEGAGAGDTGCVATTKASEVRKEVSMSRRRPHPSAGIIARGLASPPRLVFA